MTCIEDFGYKKMKQGQIPAYIASEIEDARVVGVTGASASGKSTFSSELLENFGEENACIVRLDDYVHLTNAQMREQGIKTRYDWRSRDKNRFLNDVNQLRNGHAIQKPVQDYEAERPSSESEVVLPKSYIILEGNLDLSDIADTTIFCMLLTMCC